MFLHVSVILNTGEGGGGVVSQHALQVFRSTPKGEVEGSGLRGVSRPTPREEVEGSGWGVSRPTPGGVSRSTPRRRGVSRPTPGGEGGLQAHTFGRASQRGFI